MLALIAPEDIRLSDTYVPLLKQCGYEIKTCSTSEAFCTLLKQNPELIICPSMLDNQSMVDEIKKDPEARWIIQEKMSWAGAAKLFNETQCSDVLLEIPSASNLFEALNTAKDKHSSDKTGDYAYFRWLKSALIEPQIQSPNAIQEELNEDLPDDNPDGASRLRQLENLFFSPALTGTLSKIHFGSILNHIYTDKMTGTLHLWRQSLHWCILFENGLPLDMSVFDKLECFELQSWCERHPQYQSVFSSIDERKSTREKLQEIPNSESIHHAWMTALMLEIFSWPEAHFIWKEEMNPTVPERFSPMTSDDMLKIIAKGVLEWTPDAVILEVTQSCLSYFFKIKDNLDRLENGLPNPAKSVAEKLKKGDTLSEMLSTFNVDNPVHQVVYLLLVTRHLDLNV